MAGLPQRVRIGTRGSALARWQAEHIAGLIRALGVETEILEIKTQGDLDQRTVFGEMGAKGIFTKELEEALLERRIDLAVHSLKDLPTKLPDGLELAAVPARESALDGWFCPSGKTLAELPTGARVATGSLRREAQIRALRPDLKVVPLRGNVATRMEKVRRGEADATLLAVAGLTRLGLIDQLTATFDPDSATPPMGQGALGIEARAGELAELWAALEDPEARRAVNAERAFLGRIGGGCKTPAGVYARREEGSWRVTAMLASPDGLHLIRRTIDGLSEAALMKRTLALADAMLGEASPEILATLSPEPAGEKESRLSDCTILLTRPSESGGALASILESAGARVIESPAIEFESLLEQNIEPIRSMLGALAERGGWLALPSPTAVRHFGEVLSRLNLSPADLSGLRIAAIGPGSSAALGELGLRADFLPARATAEDLATTLPVENGAPVVILGSGQTRPELREGLAKRGVMTQTLPLYAPRPSAEGLGELRAALEERKERPRKAMSSGSGDIWMVSVASPSAVDAILDEMEGAAELLGGLGWIAIGPTTGKRLGERGIGAEFTIEAGEPRNEAILESAIALARRLRGKD